MKYTTKDGDAKAGVKYVAKAGTLDFAATGEAFIEIQILDNATWETDFWFAVEITAYSETPSCHVVPSRTRVIIMDDDRFPSVSKEILADPRNRAARQMMAAWLHEEVTARRTKVIQHIMAKAAVAFYDTVITVLVPTWIVDYAVGKAGSLRDEQFSMLLYFVAFFALATIATRVFEKNYNSGSASLKTTLRLKLIRKFTTLESFLMEKEGREEV